MESDGPQYLYVQAAARLEADIRAGVWAYGAHLPGRERLAERYEVSDRTMRKALRVLEGRGIVRVLPSSGAWVTWAGHNRAHDNPLKTD